METEPDEERVPFHEHPLLEEIAKARLGYAVVNLCNSTDLGRGPVIHHRKSTYTDLDKVEFLKKMLRDGGINRTSNDPNQHVSLLVKRSALQVDRLEQDPKATTYPAVEWLSKACVDDDKIAMIADGRHRMALAHQLGQNFLIKMSRSHLLRLREEAFMAYWGITPPTSYTLPVDIKRRVLQKHGNWHCTIYDMDLIQMSPNVEAIMQAFSQLSARRPNT